MIYLLYNNKYNINTKNKMNIFYIIFIGLIQYIFCLLLINYCIDKFVNKQIKYIKYNERENDIKVELNFIFMILIIFIIFSISIFLNLKSNIKYGIEMGALIMTIDSIIRYYTYINKLVQIVILGIIFFILLYEVSILENK